MDKNEVENVFRKTGRKPVSREKMGNYDLYFADGFSQPPHQSYVSAGGVQSGDFPAGMFVTTWWFGRGEKLLIGRDLFFNISEFSQDSRLAAAREDALSVYKRLKRLH